MKQLLVIILFFLFSSFLFGNDVPIVSLSKVTPEGGVTYNSVQCIGEDEMGFIWFGTNDGLFSYNSIEIKRYTHFQNDSSSIPTNRINGIFKDNLGQLWIVTESGLCSYNRKNDSFKTHSITDQSNNFIGSNIRSFFQADDGTYWFSDERGFGTLDFDLKRAKYLSNENIRLISLDESGTIWSFYSNGDIYYLPKHATDFVYFSKALSNNIRSVFVDSINV